MRGEGGPVRVLHCLWDGETGGAERAVYQLVRQQLRDPDLAPALLFAQAHGPYCEAAKALGCPVVELDLPHGHAIGALGRSVNAMKGFDLHHFHSPEPLLMLASLRCRGVRRVFTRRGGSVDYTLRKRAQHLVVGRLLRAGFHGFSGNTAHGARWGGRLFGIAEDRFAVTYNGLDFALLEPKRPAAALRTELGFDVSQFVLGTSAKLKAWKRVERLIYALHSIADSRLRLLIVGDGEERGSLESIARQLGASERTSFVGLQAHVADYLQVMDAFCLPSASPESFGNAAVEAMALGVPTIVFADGGGTVEHIDPGRTGFIVDDQAELVTVLGKLLENRALRERIGRGGRETVRTRYTPERAAAAYRRLYETAMSGSPHCASDEPLTGDA